MYLRYAGIRPVVVHGGGPQISSMLERLGIAERVPRRLPRDDPRGDGRRADGAVGPGEPRARAASSTSTARSPPASRARTRGSSAVAGAARSSTARRSTSGSSATSSRSTPSRVLAQLDAGRIPVVSSIAPDGDAPGQSLNVNADSAAASLAVALGAAKLVILTDVAGPLPRLAEPRLARLGHRRARAPRAAAVARVGHDPEDGRLPRGGRGRRRRRPPSSTGACRTRSCSRSSRQRASAPRSCPRCRHRDRGRRRMTAWQQRFDERMMRSIGMPLAQARARRGLLGLG